MIYLQSIFRKITRERPSPAEWIWEFLHFWNGAAGADLQPLAEEAFGWPVEWETQLENAKETFPGIQ